MIVLLRTRESDEDFGVTKGKMYDVIEETDDVYKITNDKGEKMYYTKKTITDYFHVLRDLSPDEEFRNALINISE